jgi:hypothetical protein
MGMTLEEQIARIKHIGTYQSGILTCDDGTKWHPAELLVFALAFEKFLVELENND